MQSKHIVTKDYCGNHPCHVSTWGDVQETLQMTRMIDAELPRTAPEKRENRGGSPSVLLSVNADATRPSHTSSLSVLRTITPKTFGADKPQTHDVYMKPAGNSLGAHQRKIKERVCEKRDPRAKQQEPSKKKQRPQSVRGTSTIPEPSKRRST